MPAICTRPWAGTTVEGPLKLSLPCWVIVNRGPKEAVTVGPCRRAPRGTALRVPRGAKKDARRGVNLDL